MRVVAEAALPSLTVGGEHPVVHRPMVPRCGDQWPGVACPPGQANDCRLGQWDQGPRRW
jgi:hypothetical protein